MQSWQLFGSAKVESGSARGSCCNLLRLVDEVGRLLDDDGSLAHSGHSSSTQHTLSKHVEHIPVAARQTKRPQQQQQHMDPSGNMALQDTAALPACTVCEGSLLLKFGQMYDDVRRLVSCFVVQNSMCLNNKKPQRVTVSAQH
jgi:hypothetical protein